MATHGAGQQPKSEKSESHLGSKLKKAKLLINKKQGLGSFLKLNCNPSASSIKIKEQYKAAYGYNPIFTPNVTTKTREEFFSSSDDAFLCGVSSFMGKKSEVDEDPESQNSYSNHNNELNLSQENNENQIGVMGISPLQLPQKINEIKAYQESDDDDYITLRIVENRGRKHTK